LKGAPEAPLPQRSLRSVSETPPKKSQAPDAGASLNVDTQMLYLLTQLLSQFPWWISTWDVQVDMGTGVCSAPGALLSGTEKGPRRSQQIYSAGVVAHLLLPLSTLGPGR
jgi:hypothetical protein